MARNFSFCYFKKRLKIIFNIWSKLRDQNLKKVDLVVTECKLYAEKLNLKEKNIESKVLYLNSGKKDIKKELSEQTIVDTDIQKCIKFLYIGSINNIIDINGIITFLKHLKQERNVHLEIIGGGESKVRLIKELRRNDISFKDNGIIFDENIKMQIIKDSHFGINLMKKEVLVGLTMKSVDYFSYGIPIVNNIKGDTYKFVVNENTGFNYLGNEDEVIDKLLCLSNDEYLSMRTNCIELHNKYFSNYSTIKQIENIFQ